jgi:hypothetical protein
MRIMIKFAFPVEAGNTAIRDGKAERVFQGILDAIAEFIRSKGITRCPTACVLPTQGLIAAADRIALEHHAVARDRLHRERAATRWGQISPQKG